MIRAQRRERAAPLMRLGRGLRGLRAARPPRLSERGAAARPAAAGAHRPPPDRQRRHGGRRGAAAARRSASRERAIERGLVDVRWPARMQRLDSGPLPPLLTPGSELWLDGGHNAGRRRGPGADAGRSRGAGAEARLPHRRHDGPEGRRGLPRAVPRPRAPRRHGADPGRARGAARARGAGQARATSASRPSRARRRGRARTACRRSRAARSAS